MVNFFDPYVPQYKERGVVREGEKELTKKLLESADIVVITAAHTNVDYAFVQKYSKAIFDTKNVMKEVKMRENIEVL